MGLFDYINCRYKLTGDEAAREYQTKDTPAQYMDHYEIREDGTLWHQAYETEDRSDPNATGFARIIGISARVNDRWKPCDFTGAIEFYDSDLCFVAFIVNGRTVGLHRIVSGKAVEL